MEVKACGAGEIGNCVYLTNLREEFAEELEQLNEEMRTMQGVFNCNCGCLDAILAGGYAGAGCLNCENERLREEATKEGARARLESQYNGAETKVARLKFLIEKLEEEMDSAQKQQIVTPHLPTTLETVLRELYRLAKGKEELQQ